MWREGWKRALGPAHQLYQISPRALHLREQQLRRQLAAAASFTAAHRQTLQRASDSNEPIILALVGDR